jgi:hypothetical protein
MLAALVAGCVANQPRPVTYKVGNATYTDIEEFLAEVRRQDDLLLAQVRPASQRLGGSAAVVLPSASSLRTTLLNNAALKTEVMESTARINDVHLTVDGMVIEKGHIFDRVRVLRSDDPMNADAGDADYKIWLDRYGASNKWTLVKRGGQSHELVVSPGSVGRLNWMNSLNIAVINAAADIGAPVKHQALPLAPTTGASTGPVSGTAFFIDSLGHAMTNAHVVQGCKTIQMALGGGNVAEAKVAASDPQNDLALLSVIPAMPFYARIGAVAPRQGDTVVAYGFPLAGALSTQGNLSTGIVSALAGLRDDSRLFQISAPIQAGNSGGPLLDHSGNIVGVVSSKINALQVAAVTGDVPQNVNFAIKASVVSNFLETNGVKFEHGVGGKTMELADISEKAKAFTFMITCSR